MAEKIPVWDARLLADIRAVVAEIDPMPSDVTLAAKAAIGWRLVDTFLAELIEDTELAAIAGIRSGGPSRLMTFEAGPLTVEVEVAVIGHARRLVGQVVPPSAGEIEVRHCAGSTTTQADDLGHFLVEGVPPGPTSLVYRLAEPGTPPIATSWVTI